MTKAPDSQNPVGPSKALIRALSALLRPLIRMLIAKGVTLPYFTEVAKAVYVDAAQDFADDPGKPLNQSRVSLITGVHRKDIRRLQDAHDVPSARGRAESMGSRLIGIWVGSAAFIDAAGNPLALPRTASADLPSFETLVRTVSTDVRPRSILDEWLRLGLVEIDQDDLIHLNISAFVPRDDFNETAYFYGRNLRDHIAAASHNLMGCDPPPPFLSGRFSTMASAPSRLPHWSKFAVSAASKCYWMLIARHYEWRTPTMRVGARADA